MTHVIGRGRYARAVYPESHAASGSAPDSIQLGVKTTDEQFQPAPATSPIADLVATFTDWTPGDFLKIECALSLEPLGGDFPAINFNGFVVVTIAAVTYAISYDGVNAAVFQVNGLQGAESTTIPIIVIVPCPGAPSAQLWISQGDIADVGEAVWICERISAAAVNSPTPMQLIPFTPP